MGRFLARSDRDLALTNRHLLRFPIGKLCVHTGMVLRPQMYSSVYNNDNSGNHNGNKLTFSRRKVNILTGVNRKSNLLYLHRYIILSFTPRILIRIYGYQSPY